MIDPLSAFGLVANIVDLLQVSGQVVSQAYGFLQSASDALPQNEALARLASSNKVLADGIQRFAYKQRPLSPHETRAQDAAARCAREASILLDELRRLKPNRSSGKIRSMFSAMNKSMATSRKQKSLVAKQMSLQASESQLAIALLDLIQHDQTVRFHALEVKLDDFKVWSQSQPTKPGSLLAYRDELKRVMDQQRRVMDQHALQQKRAADQHSKYLQDHSNLIQDGIKRSKAYHDETQKQWRYQQIRDRITKIRRSLRFDGMDERWEHIAEAYTKTFEWCFDASKSPFHDWLVRGDELFWIGGQAASGKSTLMKFICNDDRTREGLKTWAKGGPFILAQHFFWHAGTPLQKSHLGLLRCLLYQILTSYEQHPSAWSALYASGLSERDPGKPWNRSELVMAIQSLVLGSRVSVCMFIDGLDEYDPPAEHDTLVGELVALSKIPNVKLCISSRPWTVFDKHFEGLLTQIRLENMTRNDIARYARDHLGDDLPVSIKEDLVQRVTDKSQGVFLWVSLVVSALRERVDAGNNSKQLLKCLNDFPAKLGDYFRESIYKRINGTWRDATAHALKMALLISQHQDERQDLYENITSSDHLNSFLPFWVLQRTDKNGEYTVKKPNFATSMKTRFITESEFKGMIKATKKHINGCCKDFLTISERSNCEASVQFLHRTVYDFLSSDEMTKLLNEHVPTHWRNKMFLLNVALACVKVAIRENDWPKDEQDKIVFGLVKTILKALPATPPKRGQRNYQAYFAAMTEIDIVGCEYVKTVCKGAYWYSSEDASLEGLKILLHRLDECNLRFFANALNRASNSLELDMVQNGSVLLPAPDSGAAQRSQSRSNPGSGDTELYELLSWDQSNIMNIINGSFEGASRDRD